MIIAPKQKKPAAQTDRRQQPRASTSAPLVPLAPPVPLATLQKRIDQEHSGDYYVLRNGHCLLAYRYRFRDYGFKSFKELFAQVTGQRLSTINSNDISRRLNPARVIAAEEAWESNLGPDALRIIRRHTKEERAVFFAVGRRAARARSAGQRVKGLSNRALRVLSDEALALNDPADRVALLRQRLDVRPEDCVAPLVPKSEQDLPRETPPPLTLDVKVNRMFGSASAFARHCADVRRDLEGRDGPVAAEVRRKLAATQELLGVEILGNVSVSVTIADRTLEEPAPAPRPKKPRPVVVEPPPVNNAPPPPPVHDTPPSPPVNNAPPPPPVNNDTPPVRDEPKPSPTAAEAPVNAAPDPAPAAAPPPPDAVDYAPPAAQVIVAGGAPAGWVRAEWLVLVAAINAIITDDEAFRLNDLLQGLARQNGSRYACHEELQELLDSAQAREGAFSAAVVPLYTRWLEWVGSLNIYSRHYTAVAMIASLRRANWTSAIYALRYGKLPDDLRQDISRAGNTFSDPYGDWERPVPKVPTYTRKQK